jgi:hypothetical protein
LPDLPDTSEHEAECERGQQFEKHQHDGSILCGPQRWHSNITNPLRDVDRKVPSLAPAPKFGSEEVPDTFGLIGRLVIIFRRTGAWGKDDVES